MSADGSSDTAFSDILSGNQLYTEHFESQQLTGVAKKGLAVVTCIDSRIDPLALMGMQAGDVKILRNAGARVTEDVLRTLVLASHLLGVNRVLILPHTDCRMASAAEAEVHAEIMRVSGIDSRGIEIRTVSDQQAALELDITRVRSFPLLAPDVVVGGAIFDVRTGELNPMNF
ncbi:MAG: carbonic anhydrase [Candidatus Nanopelagicales bacterium]|nr:carbonic anhydrase [Candidatus Nanopelagicales bacterium]